VQKTNPSMLFAAVALALLGLPCARAAIISGQIDNFGTPATPGTQSWDTGSNNPFPPTAITSGGPAGASDVYLRIASNGVHGPGGKLVAFNSAQWAGDYVGAGVNAIRMQVDNQGATALTLRLIFVNNLGQTVTTVGDANVPAASGWTTVTFPLTPANLSGSSFSSVMSAVTELDLVHSPTVIPARSSAPDIVAQLGVDKVAALREPTAATAPLTAAAVAAVVARRGRRRRRWLVTREWIRH
jgi:hypothetical protein